MTGMVMFCSFLAALYSVVVLLPTWSPHRQMLLLRSEMKIFSSVTKKSGIFAPIENLNNRIKMKEENVEKIATEEGVVSSAEHFFVKYQKAIIFACMAVVVVVLAFFGIRKFYSQPRQEKANAAIFAAEQYFAQNDYQTALNGNEAHDGFLAVAERYGNTKAGQRAKYNAGLCYLHLGSYDEAAKMLAQYHGKDLYTPILAAMAEGDAKCELGQNKEALKLYEQAAAMDDNFITTPMAYFKAGMMYVIMGDGAKAKDAFEKVKNYPESTEYRDIDKYITMAANL